MKRTHLLTVASLTLLLFSCSKDRPIPVEIDIDPCGASNLEITEAAMDLYSNQIVWGGSDTLWRWHRAYDTLIIRYISTYGDEGTLSRYMEFVITDCIKLIRDYDRPTVLLSLPGIPPLIIENDYELNFQLQEWDEQNRLVGKNNDTEIWVEFKPDNRY